MGCDIHFFVETLDDVLGWVSADKWATEKYGGHEFTSNYDHAFYSDRNYVLFSVLADVRNAYDVRPIGERKGFPFDASMEVKKVIADDADGHSVSHNTVQELMAYDWTQPIHLGGWVDMAQYLEFKRKGEPEGWCSGVGGGTIEHVSNERMDQLIEHYIAERKFDSRYALSRHLDTAGVEPLSKYRHYTEIEWTVPTYSMCKSFLAETMPRLWRLGSPDRVRCVFYFDN